MLKLRSPWFPLFAGGLFLLLSLLAFFWAEKELVGWVLLTLAFPLIWEGEGWREAAYSAPLFYEIDPEPVHWEAYNPKEAMPRYVLLYLYMASILAAREADALSDNWWSVAILTVPVVLYACMAIASHIRNIRSFARAKGIESNWAKRKKNR